MLVLLLLLLAVVAAVVLVFARIAGADERQHSPFQNVARASIEYRQ